MIVFKLHFGNTFYINVSDVPAEICHCLDYNSHWIHEIVILKFMFRWLSLWWMCFRLVLSAPTPLYNTKHRGTPDDTTEHWRTPADTTEHHRTPVDTTEHWRTPGDSTKHQRTPEDTTEHRRIPLNTGEHQRIPMNTTEYQRTLKDTTKHRKIPLNTTEHHWTPEDTTEFSSQTAVFTGQCKIGHQINSWFECAGSWLQIF